MWVLDNRIHQFEHNGISVYFSAISNSSCCDTWSIDPIHNVKCWFKCSGIFFLLDLLQKYIVSKRDVMESGVSVFSIGFHFHLILSIMLIDDFTLRDLILTDTWLEIELCSHFSVHHPFIWCNTSCWVWY